jgi:DNA invertase Pin-like site-specific DNA recombinase
MIFDCYENRIDIVLVKTISRFARNTVDLLETVNRLKGLGVEIIFYQENLQTSETDKIVANRSNIEIVNGKAIRKGTHYSSKNKKQD